MGKYSREHIGNTLNSGKFVVTDGGDKRGYVKVKCSICAEDEELYGHAEYHTTMADINRGRLPCGCSNKPKWTLPQYKVLIERKITKESLPIEFVDFGAQLKPLQNTSIELFCKVSRLKYTVSTISSFMRGVGNQGMSDSVENQIVKFNNSNPTATVWVSGRKSYRNILGYYCKVCDERGFESVYTILSNNLINRSNIPCLCAKYPSVMSDEHKIERSKVLLQESQTQDVSVIGLFYKGRVHYVVFLCSYHGVYSRKFHSLKITGCYCPKCTPPKFGYDTDKKGYLYLLEIQTLHETILGYGITNKLSDRLSTHKRNLASLGASITSTTVYEGSGSAVQAVENSIKSLHKTGLLDCEGFRRESLSIERKQEVLELCKDLKLKA